jgi:VIT1/CCC1 family predicted Fe2+/Mn2+ transporter
VPLLAILLPSVSARVPVTFAAVLAALAMTGTISARIGGARRTPAVARNVVGGALALLVTFGVGTLIGGRSGLG